MLLVFMRAFKLCEVLAKLVATHQVAGQKQVDGIDNVARLTRYFLFFI